MLGQLAQAGIGLGFNSVLLKFSRTDESQADALGARMMAEAGYNPIEMARFFEKLDASGGARGPQFLSDHPNPGQPREGNPGRDSCIAAGQLRISDRRVPACHGGARRPAGAYERGQRAQRGQPPVERRPQRRMAAAPRPDLQRLLSGNWQTYGDGNPPP